VLKRIFIQKLKPAVSSNLPKDIGRKHVAKFLLLGSSHVKTKKVITYFQLECEATAAPTDDSSDGKSWACRPGVSNIRPAGQNRPVAWLNPARGMIL